jgi:alkylated DNA repair dioxygenase AlkB
MKHFQTIRAFIPIHNVKMYLPGILDLDEKNILPKDGVVSYIFPFYSEEESNSYFNDLMTLIEWKQDKMKMYDKILPLPRLTCFFGKESLWPPLLLKMKADVEKQTGFIFNCVLLNLYRDENDHVSWHSDRGTYEDSKIIASLSLGEERNFQLRHKFDKKMKVFSLGLKPGSLIVMNDIQRHWQHRVAKTTQKKGPRINLTFRKIESDRSVTYDENLVE